MGTLVDTIVLTLLNANTDLAWKNYCTRHHDENDVVHGLPQLYERHHESPGHNLFEARSTENKLDLS